MHTDTIICSRLSYVVYVLSSGESLSSNFLAEQVNEKFISHQRAMANWNDNKTSVCNTIVCIVVSSVLDFQGIIIIPYVFHASISLFQRPP